MNKLPLAKLENIVVQNLDGETLIYNLTTNQAFCLNETAAKVFTACADKITFDELKESFQFTNDLIYLALDGLKTANLIADDYVSPFAGLSRREVIRKIGLASIIALPVISALVAPSAAFAVSVTCSCTAPLNVNANARTAGCACLNNGDCCGVCIINGGGAGMPICSSPTAGAQASAAACCPPLP